MASREANKQVKVTDQMPNKRERASAQFGQLDDLNGANWNGLPNNIKEAIDRLAAEVAALKAGTIDP